MPQTNKDEYNAYQRKYKAKKKAEEEAKRLAQEEEERERAEQEEKDRLRKENGSHTYSVEIVMLKTKIHEKSRPWRRQPDDLI